MTQPPWYDGEPSEPNYPDPPDVAAAKAEKAAVERKRSDAHYQQSARLKLAHFEKWVRMHEMKGSYHPDLRDWIDECYRIARLRMLAELWPVWPDVGLDLAKGLKMPPKPEIDYDR